MGLEKRQLHPKFFAMNGSLRMASLNCFLTNKKEAFEFAVTKLPSYKISKEARLKLKKKYGIIVE